MTDDSDCSRMTSPKHEFSYAYIEEGSDEIQL